MTYTLLLLLPALASASCSEGCERGPTDCDDMKAMLGPGGCAESCTKADIITAYNTPGEGGDLARRCYTAEGVPVCHNCQDGPVVEDCNDL